MINIIEFMTKCNEITNFYKLAAGALQHPVVLKEEVDRQVYFLINFVESPLGKQVFIGDKETAKNIFTPQLVEKVAKKSAQTSIVFLGRQTVILFHSYIEIIMNNIVRMILAKDEDILKRIYFEKGKDLPFNAADLIDNKNGIVTFMIEKETSRFVYKSMKDKIAYFKKFFGIDYAIFQKGEVEYGIDIFGIDTLRHDIIHTNKPIVVDGAKVVEIGMYIQWFGIHLLTQARTKFNVDIIWQFPNGINYLK